MHTQADDATASSKTTMPVCHSSGGQVLCHLSSMKRMQKSTLSVIVIVPTSVATQTLLGGLCVMAGACSIIDCLRDDGSLSPFPLIRCENIFVLPGVPDLLQAKWKVISSLMQYQEAHQLTIQP